ncbi:MAG: Re/Si-specific NAD(P)(+) transhydrogenase subunit alpha [Candidatus Zixiibacteriota bacterium]
MKVAVPKERRAYERRVAATPDTVRKLCAIGLEVTVESEAGLSSSITDKAYQLSGATIASTLGDLYDNADIVLKVQRPLASTEGGEDELSLLKPGCILIGFLSPTADDFNADQYASNGIVAFAVELLPRITRAQTMDVLSSQSNLAGYKAVLDAAHEFSRALPMMMTAAGTIPPAKALVIGAGVAGLQAIATARRLGAVVSAFDVRPAVKEQVESLGAKFVEVESEEAELAETSGGYAREMTDEYKHRQALKLFDTVKTQDIVICTALIPGRPAPEIITEDMVKQMKPGSIIVDLAVEQGGNCSLSVVGEVVVKHGVTLVGHRNVPSRLAADASMLYARNLLAFTSLLVDKETGRLNIDWDDEIIKGTLLTRDSKVVHPLLTDKNGGT